MPGFNLKELIDIPDPDFPMINPRSFPDPAILFFIVSFDTDFNPCVNNADSTKYSICCYSTFLLLDINPVLFLIISYFSGSTKNRIKICISTRFLYYFNNCISSSKAFCVSSEIV